MDIFSPVSFIFSSVWVVTFLTSTCTDMGKDFMMALWATDLWSV